MARETVFIVLFRGVGGATQLPTGPLRKELAAAGFDNVATYINSGNAVVSTRLGEEAAKARIAEITRAKFGFTKDVFLVSRDDWRKLIDGNPFPESVDVPTSVHAFVLSSAPDQAAIHVLKARAAHHERLVVTGAVMYFHAPEGFGMSKLPPIIDRTLGVVSTARNWRSVLKLMELAEKA